MEEDKIFYNIKEACQTVFGWEKIGVEELQHRFVDSECTNNESDVYKNNECLQSMQDNSNPLKFSKVTNMGMYCYPKPVIQIFKNQNKNIFTFDKNEVLEINKLVKKIKQTSFVDDCQHCSKHTRPSMEELKMCLSLLEAVKMCINSKQKEKKDKQRGGKVRFRLPQVGQI